MYRIFRHILMIMMLIAATNAAGQYIIDRVCVGSVRYYRIDGQAGSTYTWRLTDPWGNITTLPSNADTIQMVWNVAAGNYKLSAVQHSITNCDGIIEIGDIQVFDGPLADAGNSLSVCDIVPTQLSGSASNYSHVSWTTTGDGSFSNDTILSPVYTPGPADIAAGNVKLYLTAYGLGDTASCTPAIDSLTIIEAPDVIASAGPNDTSCQYSDYQILNATASNYGRLAWTHNGTGTILNPGVINPVYVPGAGETGLITFTLKAYDILPCLDSVTDQMDLLIYPLPTAMLILTGRDTLCGGDTTSFRVDLTGTAPWSITINDGVNDYTYNNITSSPFFVNIAPPATSTFTITALSDQHCTGLPSGIGGVIHIIVFPRPGAEYTWNYGNQNNEIEFWIDSLAVNFPAVGDMVLWNFGDGTYGYETNPVHLYPAPGDYICTLTVTDTNGCVSYVSHLITIPVVPIAFFSSTSPACLGTPVCFTDLSTVPAPPFGYIVKWVWSFGDGTPDVTINFPDNPHVCHLYSQIGTYPATLTITDNTGYVSSCTRNQSVIPVPVASFEHTGACNSQSVQFTDTSNPNNGGAILSWSWNFGDPLSGTDNTSSLQNPIHTFTAGNTTYNVRLVIVNYNNCTDTVINPVFVKPSPPLDFTYDSACIASVINFTATGVAPDSIGTWSWDFGDGTPPVNTPVTATHTYTSTGTYTATLTVTDIHGCINSVSHGVEVHALPVAQFSWTSGCSGLPVQFNDASYMTGGFIAKWQWDFGDGSSLQTITIPASPDVQHTFPSSSSSYNVTLKVWSNDSCIQEITHTVNIAPAPVADFTYPEIRCEDQQVHFTDASNTNGSGSIISWNWNFGDPASGSNNTSTLQNPDHTFTSAGIFSVRLIINGVTSCTDTIVKTVAINQKPVADFISDTACLNSPTTFTQTCTANAAGIISYLWNFGDGGVSNLPDPVHTYATEGLFTASLQIVNSNGCIDNINKQVYVRPLPLASFTWSPASCTGMPVVFTNTSTVLPNNGYIVRWVWDFGDGTFASIHYPASPVISHTFAGSAQAHIVRLTVVTSDSCQAYTEHTVTSASSPVADFSAQQQNCQDLPVSFTDLSQQPGGGNIISWNWNFGDPASGTANISVIQNPVHVYSASGSYTVTLIVANEQGCTDTVSKNIVIGSGPVAAFTADTACLGHPTSFTNQSSATVTQWLWNFGDGGTSNVPNPTHTYPSSGIFNVTLTVSAGSCMSTTTKQVLVLDGPLAAFATSSPGCAGDSVAFNDNSSTPHGYITTWTWIFGDGNSVTRNYPQSPDVKHRYMAPGTYTSKLIITTSDNCQAEKSIPVIIHAAPVANFTFSGSSCTSAPVQFTNTTVAPGAPVSQWLWNFDDPGSGSQNTSTLENPVHQFSTGGVFHVVLYATNAQGCMDSIVKTVTIGAGAVASFSSDVVCKGNITHFTDASTAPTGTIISWIWNFGDILSGTNNTSTLQNPTHLYTGSGTFTATLTVVTSAGCTSDTSMSVSVLPIPEALFEFQTACAGNPVQFTDLSVAPGSSIVGWFWDFGDGTGTSTVQNPAYTYTVSGTYNVKLVVTSMNGCQDSISVPVTTGPAPTAAFQYQSDYCPAGRTSFQDVSTSTGASIAQRLWIFEPGSSSNLPAPVHVFGVTDTTYMVTLIVTDGNGCSDTVINPVYVNPGFSFSFTYDTACYKTTTHFAAQNLTPGDSLYFIEWNFGDPASGTNNTSHQRNPSHVFTRGGQFTVMLKVMNSNACVDSIYRTVTVNQLPVPAYDYSILSGGKVLFSDRSTSGNGSIAMWEWNFGDGTAPVFINAPGPGDITHVFAKGNYNVTLKVTNSAGCTDSFTKTVSIQSSISAWVDTPDSVVCARYPVTFHDRSYPVDMITSWRWMFGDGYDTSYTSYTPTIVHTYAVGGTYIVRIFIDGSVDGNNFSDSTSIVMLVRPTPVTSFTMNTACEDNPSHFNDISDNTGLVLGHREWNFGDPQSGILNFSDDINPAHKYINPGTYNVRLVLTTNYGCSDTMRTNAVVHSLPRAAFENNNGCTGNPTQFTDLSYPGDTAISMWHWNFGVPKIKDDTSLLKNPVYWYRDAGTYPVKLMVEDKYGCLDTASGEIDVTASPVSAFRIVDPYQGIPGRVLLNNLSTGADFFYWDFGNGGTSKEESPIVTYSDDGSYLIRLITYNKHDCSDTTFYKLDLLFKGLFIPNAFAPTSGNPEVAFFKPIGVNLLKFRIEVYNAWGDMLWSSDRLDSMGRPLDRWDGTDSQGRLQPQGTYMWKVNAVFMDGTIWEGSDIGKGEYSNKGTVTLIR